MRGTNPIYLALLFSFHLATYSVQGRACLEDEWLCAGQCLPKVKICPYGKPCPQSHWKCGLKCIPKSQQCYQQSVNGLLCPNGMWACGQTHCVKNGESCGAKCKSDNQYVCQGKCIDRNHPCHGECLGDAKRPFLCRTTGKCVSSELQCCERNETFCQKSKGCVPIRFAKWIPGSQSKE